MAQRNVVVTGVAGYWGALVAARLAVEPGYHVIGLDAEQPDEALPGLDFIQADIRDPLLVELLRSEGVDSVCHLAFRETVLPSESAFDANVMGTLKLLCACATAGVRKVVLRSSTEVYGARVMNSSFLKEDCPLQGSRRYGRIRDMLEIEASCAEFRKKVPELMLTILRFASIIGPTADTPMTRLLRDTSKPLLLGFDPMMQLIHEDDVVGALVHAVGNDMPGVFNIGAKDTLPLNKVRGLAGKLPVSVFHPFVYWGMRMPGGSLLQTYLPFDPAYLRFPWVGDLTKMSAEMGFEPSHTAAEALREFSRHKRRPRQRPKRALAAGPEQPLGAIIDMRRQSRGQPSQEDAHSGGQ